jgi:hypothetical protein
MRGMRRQTEHSNVFWAQIQADHSEMRHTIVQNKQEICVFESV